MRWMRRRDFLGLRSALATGALVGSSPWLAVFNGSAHAGEAGCDTNDGPYGPLLDPDENGIMLPAGFRSRVVGRAGAPVEGTDYVWHRFPDGGATYRAPGGGWIYASNSEATGPVGVSAIHFDRDGVVVDAYSILTGTILNCAGGATPWNTWLSCEEHDNGYVWECDPTGAVPGIKREAMGTFKHEAVAADPRRRHFYLTEDHPDGCFYRFTPTQWGDLSAGLLEVASVALDGAVSWLPVPAPNDTATPTRRQVPGAKAFRGGEGVVYWRWHVYFTTKGDSRVWDYNTIDESVRVFYNPLDDPNLQLTGVDNIAVTPGGDLMVAEDGGNMELVLLSPRGAAVPLLRIIGQDSSEIAGPAFAPYGGNRIYFSSQRGGETGQGLTYEVSGPMRRSWPRPCSAAARLERR